jgi:hypothetical protein
MNMKRKIFDIRGWKRKHLFLDISSTNNYTFIPSLYQCVETCSIAVFWLLFQPLLQLRFITCYFRTSLSEYLDPAVNRFPLQTLPTINRRRLFMHILCIEHFYLQKSYNRTLLFGSTPLKHGRHFDTQISLWACACASAI